MSITAAQKLHNILQTELQTSQQLLQLLMDERQALIESDADVINDMSEKKQPLVFQLEHLGKQRELVLQSTGFTTDKSGISAYIANQVPKEAKVLNNLLSKLRATAKICRENNQINGGIANVNRQYIQRAINVFRGKDINAAAYGPGGEYTSQVVRQPLIGRV